MRTAAGPGGLPPALLTWGKARDLAPVAFPSRLRQVLPAWAARALIVLSGSLILAALLGRLADADPQGAGLYSPHPVAALTFGWVGLAIVFRQPRNAFGWLLFGVGLATGAIAVAASWAGFHSMLWLNQWLPAVAYGLLPLALMVFPDGRLPGPKWSVGLFMGVAGLALAAVATGWVALYEPSAISGSPEDLDGRLRLGMAFVRVGALLMVLTSLAAVAGLVVRWRRSNGVVRQQIRVLAIGASALPVGLVLEIVNIPASDLVLALAVPMAAGAAVLKYRLFDLDLFVNRTVVYLIVTLALGAGYFVLALFAGVLLGGGWATSAVPTGVVAVAFQPVRARAQKGVSRLLYGERDDPYAALSRIGRILEPAAEPEAVLDRVVEAVIDTLELPFACIEAVDSSGAGTIVALRGRRLPGVAVFPMVHNGQIVGRLSVCARTMTGSLTGGERRLLDELASQIGVALRAMQLTDDLRASRIRLVHAREDERRRLRSELHDGLGPALAGATMQVAAARGLPQQGVHTALNRLEEILRLCLGEVRQMVQNLRPPSLDSLGLMGAVRQSADMLSGFAEAPEITVTSELDAAPLPAAVEVAAYRIATEAMTNAARHSGARTCRVSLKLEGDLVVEVADDGKGLPADFAAGVGLGSMRERAEELGGGLSIRSGASGTEITARLPLEAR